MLSSVMSFHASDTYLHAQLRALDSSVDCSVAWDLLIPKESVGSYLEVTYVA